MAHRRHRLTAGALRIAALAALRDLNPTAQWRNPVMFVTWCGALACTLLGVRAVFVADEAAPGFVFGVAVWLWLTVWFANLAEAVAVGRGRAQAAALRGMRTQTLAHRVARPDPGLPGEAVPADALRRGDLVVVRAGEVVPGDGEVVLGVASVDESAITGESAPVLREAGGDRSAVTGGTRLLSDWLIVRIGAVAGESFLDHMIAMVEGAKRRKTPNELALDVLLAALTLTFLIAVATLQPFREFAARASGRGGTGDITSLVALLVCLIPTTIGGLLAAIRIAGLDRLVQANVIATSGRAVEAAGDVEVLLLDKTGTITLGARQAARLLPAPGVTLEQLADAAWLASIADETPEGRSVVVLCKRHGLRERDLAVLHAKFVAFSARTRMSGVDLPGRTVRKGAAEAIAGHLRSLGGELPPAVAAVVEEVARGGATPLVVVEGMRALGLVELRDTVKGGLRERFVELRRMGIRTIMVTGDNPITAAAIAVEAGVDDVLAEATPERKLACIREHQAAGRLVAMAGDGTNDAPALAQADVAVAMQTGTQAAREAGNMVDLDSNPTKLIEIVAIGRQLLMTRGALTTFSLANDVAKYFAILPAMLAPVWPQLQALDVMELHSPASAVLAAVVFNALVLPLLIPLAVRGVAHRPRPAAATLRHNLLVYGLGGLIAPFAGIKAIDTVVTVLGAV
jgi:K+-transporting ATPase ATPase B chain